MIRKRVKRSARSPRSKSNVGVFRQCLGKNCSYRGFRSPAISASALLSAIR